MKARHLLATAALAAASGAALAHPGHATGSLASGFGHSHGEAELLLGLLTVAILAVGAFLRRRAKARIEKYARSRRIPVITCQVAMLMIEETVGRDKLGAGWDTLLARTRFEPADAPPPPA